MMQKTYFIRLAQPWRVQTNFPHVTGMHYAFEVKVQFELEKKVISLQKLDGSLSP